MNPTSPSSMTSTSLTIHEVDLPTISENLNKNGDAYFEKGDFKNALQNYNKALETEKKTGNKSLNYALVLNDIGKCHYALGDFQNAISMHSEASTIFTEVEDIERTCNYLGKAQQKNGDSDSALKNFKTAIKNDSGNLGIKADALYNLAEFELDQGEFEEALKYSQDSLNIRKSLFTKPHREIAESLNQLGCIYLHLNKNDDALIGNLDALQMKRQVYGPKAHPSVADSLHDVGSSYEAQGDFAKALEFFKEALEMDREIRGADTKHADIAIVLGHISNILRELGFFEEAKKYSNECLEMNKSINDGKGIAQALNCMGDLSVDLGSFAEAKNFYEQALAKKKEVYADNPNHPSISTSINDLANVYMALDCFDKASSYYEQSLDIYKLVYGENTAHSSIAILLQHMGDVCRARGLFQKALDYYEKCLEMQQKVLLGSENHPHIFIPLHKKGEALAHLGHFDEALDCLKQSLKIKEKFYQKNHYDISKGLNSVGKVLEKLGRFDEALKCFEDAVEKDRDYDHVETHHLELSLHNVSSCQGFLGRFEKALELEQRALAHVQKFYGATHSKSARSFRHIGLCFYSLGDYSKALEVHNKALEIYKTIFGNEHPEVAISLSHLAKIHGALQKFEEAINIQKDVHKILLKFYDKDHPLIANSLSDMGSYLFSSNIQGALDKYTESYAILEKKFVLAHPQVMLVSTCMDICSAALKKETIPEINEQTGRLNEENFRQLVAHGFDYLKNPNGIKVEKNPSGFVRIRIDLPKDFPLADQIETIRFHYWPSTTDEKIKIVEALHDHPRYFESMILNGGYSHHIYKKAEVASTTSLLLRTHRVVKAPNSQERTIFSLGTLNLDDIGQQVTSNDMILYFPKSLVHQVESFQPGTLTINAVFKGEKDLTYFDIFMPDGNRLDPQREREFAAEEESNKFIQEIVSILEFPEKS